MITGDSNSFLSLFSKDYCSDQWINVDNVRPFYLKPQKGG